MSNAFALPALAQLSQPLLSVYLNTNPASPRNCRSIPGYLVWLKSEARALLAGVSDAERSLCQAQFDQIERSLQAKRPEQRGVVFFAGPSTWQEISLQVEPGDEAHWGKPMLWQLCCMANDYRPACVAVLELSGARIFIYQFGTLTKVEARDFQVDTSQWKLRQRAHVAKQGVRVPHSSQLDIFERRLESRYQHLLADIISTIGRYCDAYSLDHVYLLGSDRLTGYLEKKLPARLRDQVTRIPHVCADEPSIRTQTCVEEKLREYAITHDEQLVADILNRGGDVITGMDTMLTQLQHGKLASVVVAEEFNPVLYQCSKCGMTVLTSGMACSRCQGALSATTLHEVLPELTIKYDCRLDIVKERAASRLRAGGDVGGRLRGTEHKMLVSSLRHSLAVGKSA